jgi:heme-degrading monooxygenase HmoA
MPIEHDAIPTDHTRPVVRVTAFEGPPDRVKIALNHAREQMRAAFQSQEGWLRTVGCTSSDGRRGMIIGFWESDQAVVEGRQTLGALRERAQAAGISIVDFSRYEVVFDEHVE